MLLSDVQRVVMRLGRPSEVVATIAEDPVPSTRCRWICQFAYANFLALGEVWLRQESHRQQLLNANERKTGGKDTLACVVSINS